jgi:hypothetical protein
MDARQGNTSNRPVMSYGVRLSDGYFSVAIEREGAEAEGKSDMEYI